MASAIQLIVGLGNPGAEYENTRHNVGAWFVKQLAEQENTTLKFESKFHGAVAKVSTFANPCWLLIPSTYMNESGRALAAITRFYKIPPESILVAHDELDFSAGTVRLKNGGGHGGHNGLRDIINHLHSKDFYRMRIGIGHPGHKDRVSPYVLSAPSKNDRELILQSIDEGLRTIADLSAGEFEKAMHYLHSD